MWLERALQGGGCKGRHWLDDLLPPDISLGSFLSTAWRSGRLVSGGEINCQWITDVWPLLLSRVLHKASGACAVVRDKTPVWQAHTWTLNMCSSTCMPDMHLSTCSGTSLTSTWFEHSLGTFPGTEWCMLFLWPSRSALPIRARCSDSGPSAHNWS